MNGRNPTTPSIANWNALASRLVAASSGIARAEICEPNSLIVWAVQSFRKSGCCQSAPCGRGNLRIGSPPVHGDGEAVGLARRIFGGLELAHQLVEPLVEARRVGAVQADADRAGAADRVVVVDVERQ